MDYVKNRGKRKGCILCGIAKNEPDLESLEIARTELSIVTVNLYPYNPGHVMVFPIRHIEQYPDLTENEALDLHKTVKKIIAVLDELYRPDGYNIGYNLGNESGASIRHIHQHVVPRYKNEVGFMDVLAGTRLFIVNPKEIRENLKKNIPVVLEKGINPENEG